MKIEFKELEKAVEYMRKNSDKGKVNLFVGVGVGSNGDAVYIEFSDPDAQTVVIKLPTDERAFGSITRTERF